MELFCQKLHITSFKVFSKSGISCCVIRIVSDFVSDSRMSPSQQKEMCTPQKLSCIIRNFWSMKKDGNCNFSENIFPGWKLLFNFLKSFYEKCLVFASVIFPSVQSNVLMREWKSISTAKKVTAISNRFQSADKGRIRIPKQMSFWKSSERPLTPLP